MIGAIVKNGLVQNLIVVNEENISEMETALGCEIVDARPYGLAVGDLRTPQGWTRNAGGEQMVLEPLEPEMYDGYSLAVKRLEGIGQEAGAEALAVLEGVDEE